MKKDQQIQAERDAIAKGDFASATSSAGNGQPAGSGGPFDPANTSAAHMTQHQRQEGLSPGNPTTGGMTPKLTPESMATMSERDREAAHAIVDEKDPDQRSKLANSGTGVATPGTAEQIVDQEKARAKAATPAAAKKVADAAMTAQKTAKEVATEKPAAKKAAAKKAR